jgi:hypothetical protein
MIQSIAADIDDANHGNDQLFARCWNTWKQPIHRSIMGEAENKFI